MRLSVIVPVYNASKYLHFTIDSLLDQDMLEDEYEILLIDDGSTDSSWQICQQYEICHPCITHAYTKQNEGVSKTRNYGLSKAKGDYVYFIDSDDFLAPGGLRYLFDNCFKEKRDVLSFGSKVIAFPQDVNSYREFVLKNELSSKEFKCETYFVGTGRQLYRQTFEIFI